jgi:NADH-quinone oxidoreductase subunit I
MLGALIKGLSTTFKYLFKKPVTVEYPEVKRPVRERFRGRHQLRRFENGMERCIGCSLCAAACPSDAILVIPAENNPAAPNSPGERYAARYEINMLRCIFCGYCEDACPTNAIVLEHQYELSFYDRKASIYDKSMLLVPVDQGHGDIPPVLQQLNRRPRPVGGMHGVGDFFYYRTDCRHWGGSHVDKPQCGA